MRLGEHRGLVSPDFRLFPGDVHGLFRRGGKSVIVSAGLGEHTPVSYTHLISHLFLAELAGAVIEGSKDGYPELEDKKDFIFNVLNNEESQFNKTIDQGLRILGDMEQKMNEKGEKQLSGEHAFKLYRCV